MLSASCQWEWLRKHVSHRISDSNETTQTVYVQQLSENYWNNEHRSTCCSSNNNHHKKPCAIYMSIIPDKTKDCKYVFHHTNLKLFFLKTLANRMEILMKLTTVQCQNATELQTCGSVIPVFWNLHIMNFVGFFTRQFL